jgi:hypothetical protein
MPTLHMTASGKICQDASTGRLKKHDAALCCVDCTHCSGSTDNAPVAYKVKFVGYTNGSCTDCLNFNRSYVVPNVSSCTWDVSKTDTGYCSHGTDREAGFSISATHVSAQHTIGLGGLSQIVTYTNTESAPHSCTGFSSKVIAYSSGAITNCNVGSSTAEVTAL